MVDFFKVNVGKYTSFMDLVGSQIGLIDQASINHLELWQLLIHT